MTRAKKTSKRRRQHTALPIFGAAGASLAMAGGASASAVPPEHGPSQARAAPYSIAVLDEEEISDVSLATFYVLDRARYLGEQVAQRGGRCGGCRGCGGAGRCGGGGCAVARCAVARCGGGCAVARCAVARCAVARCGVGVVGCAGCGCSCSGCVAPCWTWFPLGWVFVC